VADDRDRTDGALGAPETFTCQGCGATFASRHELNLHNAETHGGGSTGGNTDEAAPDVGGEELPADGDAIGV
jgi:hypothetical protein